MYCDEFSCMHDIGEGDEMKKEEVQKVQDEEVKEEKEEVLEVKEKEVLVNGLETSSVCFFSARAFRSSSLSRIIIIVKFKSYISMKEILRPAEVNSPIVMKITTITIMTSYNI